MTRLDPITPGEILQEEFLIPMGLTQYRLAKEIGAPAQRVSAIIAGKRAITADTDLRLCRFFSPFNGYGFAPRLLTIQKWPNENSVRN